MKITVMRFPQILRLFLLIIGGSTFIVSCVGSKPVPYFKGGLDTTQLQKIVIPDQLIQKGDILSITIFSDNVEATAIYNQVGSGGSTVSPKGDRGNASTGTNSLSGYLVDNNGNIRMHALGMLQVEGLTRQQLEELITNKIEKLGVLSNPYCVIRFNNFKIIVLGDVTAPGVFTIPTEKASVLEALGLAGDITTYGRKDQVMLIREIQGKRTYANLDLTDPAIFSSPYFYLRQNDVLVVQSDPHKATAADQQTMLYITLAFTAVSAVAIIISLFR